MNWKGAGLVTFLCLINCLFCFQAAAENNFPLELELPFTSVNWQSGGQNRGPEVANKLVSSPLKVGEQSLELAYDFLGVAGQLNNCSYSTFLPLPETAKVLRIWLYGDNSGHCFILRLLDEGGQTFQYWGVPINWRGWKQVQFKLGAPLQGYWGGANDGVMHGKLSIPCFLIESRPQTAVTKGKIYIGGVSVIADQKKPELELPFTSVNWQSGGQNHGPEAANRLVSSPLKVGEQSLELAYDFLKAEEEPNYCAYSTFLPLPEPADLVKIWLYGDSSGHRFILRLSDAEGQIFQYGGVPINWKGWKLIEFKLGAAADHWGGVDDGVMHGKLSIASFLVELNPQSTASKGKIYIGGVGAAPQWTENQAGVSFTDVRWENGGQHQGPETGNRFVTYPLKEGARSLELTYDFRGVAGQLNNCTYSTSLPLPGMPEILRIWLYGDSSGHCFILRLLDEGGQTFQYWGVPINWSGWKLVEVNLGAPSGHWGGSNDGVMHGKLSIASFLIESRPQTAVAKGKIYVGGISVVSRIRESESVTVDVTSSKLGNIFTEDESVKFSLRFNNYLPQSRQLSVRYWVETPNDRSFPGNTLAVTLAANGKASKEITLDTIKLNGCFNLHLQISSSDQKIIFKKAIPFSRCLAPSEKPSANILGAQTHFAHGLNRYPLKENLELLRLSGVAWYRDEMFWEYAELKKGEVKVLPEWDERIKKSLQNGLIPLLELNSGNSRHGGGVPETEEQLAAWGNYVRQMALHFRGKINHFEIWNEFNGGMGLSEEQRKWSIAEKARHYMDILQVAYRKIKEVAPEATVVGCATAGVDLAWIEEVFKAGGLAYMDGVSVHAYTNPRSPEEGGYLEQKLQPLRDLMERYGTIKPIWITEIGWSTRLTLNSTEVTELQAAAYAVRVYVLTLGSQLPVAMLNWYDLHNDGPDLYDVEHNLGLVNAAYGVEVPFAAKQNFIALCTMNRMLEGAAFLEKLETAPEMYAYKFSLPSQKQLLALWTLNYQATSTIGVKVANSCPRVDVVDLFGNRSALYPIDGIVTVSVSNEPLYLVGDFSENALCKPKFFLTDHFLNNIAGETVTVRIQGAKATAEVEQLLIDLPNGWTVKEEGGFSADSLQAYFTLNVPARIEEKPYVVPIYLLTKGRAVAQLYAVVNTREPLP